MLTEVKIDGNDVTDETLTWEVKSAFGETITEAEIQLTSDVANAPENGNTITIKRGESDATEEFVFDGYADEIIKSNVGYIVKARDKLLDLIKNEVTYSYDKNIDASAGKISDIFKDLINTYGGGVLVADDTSVQDSGTIYILDKFICNHEEVFKKCQELAELLDWQFYYKQSDGKVYFEPKGFLGQNGTLTVGTDLEEGLHWVYDAIDLANDITIFGATQEIETTESGQLDVTSGFTSGDGGYATLTYQPESVKVYADVSNPPTTLRNGGVPEATETYDYYVDKENKQIIFETSGGYDWDTNHYIEIRYSHKRPIPVTGTNEFSVATYGKHTKTFFFENLRTVNDGELKITQLLNKYSIPFVSVEAKPLTRYNLIVGETVRIIDDSVSEDRILLVNKIIKQYPHTGDILKLGDKTWKTADWQTEVMDRIIELEKELGKTTDYLVHVITLQHELDFGKYSIILSKRTIGDAFILNHPVNGILGTSKLGAGTMSGWSEEYNKTY